MAVLERGMVATAAVLHSNRECLFKSSALKRFKARVMCWKQCVQRAQAHSNLKSAGSSTLTAAWCADMYE